MPYVCNCGKQFENSFGWRMHLEDCQVMTLQSRIQDLESDSIKQSEQITSLMKEVSVLRSEAVRLVGALKECLPHMGTFTPRHTHNAIDRAKEALASCSNAVSLFDKGKK